MITSLGSLPRSVMDVYSPPSCSSLLNIQYTSSCVSGSPGSVSASMTFMFMLEVDQVVLRLRKRTNSLDWPMRNIISRLPSRRRERCQRGRGYASGTG